MLHDIETLLVQCLKTCSTVVYCYIPSTILMVAAMQILFTQHDMFVVSYAWC